MAFNRSLKAFNANKEIQDKYSNRDKHLAVDRSMKLMHFEDERGDLLGAINWFGVYATSISNDNTKICSDNKGYAAAILVQYVYKNTRKHFVHAFAQEAAGDVSPNYVWDKQENRCVGLMKMILRVHATTGSCKLIKHLKYWRKRTKKR